MEPNQRPHVTIQGATPGRITSRQCPKCRTDAGWQVRFYTFSGGTPIPLTDVTGCTSCDAPAD